MKMGDVFTGKGVTRDLVVPIPVPPDQRKRPSVIVGQTIDVAVANYYHSLFADDLYNFYFSDNLSPDADAYDDMVDTEGEEEY